MGPGNRTFDFDCVTGLSRWGTSTVLRCLGGVVRGIVAAPPVVFRLIPGVSTSAAQLSEALTTYYV